MLRTPLSTSQTLTRIAILLAALTLAACNSATKVEDLKGTLITLPDGAEIQAETMFAQVDLARGMMFRESLGADRGMLFVHQRPNRFPYWMMNTKIPLDIIWMDADRNVVEISADTPPCPSKLAKECPNFGGNFVARYVLEMNAGAAKKHEIRVGSKLAF